MRADRQAHTGQVYSMFSVAMEPIILATVESIGIGIAQVGIRCDFFSKGSVQIDFLPGHLKPRKGAVRKIAFLLHL